MASKPHLPPSTTQPPVSSNAVGEVTALFEILVWGVPIEVGKNWTVSMVKAAYSTVKWGALYRQLKCLCLISCLIFPLISQDICLSCLPRDCLFARVMTDMPATFDLKLGGAHGKTLRDSMLLQDLGIGAGACLFVCRLGQVLLGGSGQGKGKSKRKTPDSVRQLRSRPLSRCDAFDS
jgi:hypothetical protein